MGTKMDPAPNDCFYKAEMDEPLFTLLARDPMGAHFVRLWALLRGNDFLAAEETYRDLTRKLLDLHHRTKLYDPKVAAKEQEKIDEAQLCAKAMREWIKANRPERAL